MKKIISVILAITAALTFCMLSDVQAEAVSLDVKTVKLIIGEEKRLTLSGAVAENVKWYSSDEDVVSVDDGIVKGLSKGTATVSAKYNEKRYACKVTVGSYRIERKSSSVMVGNRMQLKLMGWNGKRIWNSANTSVATVGNDGIVRGISEGKTRITVSFGGRRLSFMLTVKPYNLPVSASKVSYIKFTPSCHTAEEFKNTKSVYITKKTKIRELVEYLEDLDYVFVSPADAEQQAADGYSYAENIGMPEATPDTLTFYDKNGNEIAEYITPLYSSVTGDSGKILNTFTYSQKYYSINGDSGILGRLYGWLTNNELIEAAELLIADRFPYYDGAELSRLTLMRDTQVPVGVSSSDGFVIAAEYSYINDYGNSDTVIFYINPKTGKSAETDDIIYY